jgi:SAM-dependent methyltransferase
MIDRNVHPATVAGFGDEWTRFDQRALDEAELRLMFDRYFHLVPWRSLSTESVGFDLGCGSGRWARFVAPRVGTLHCVDVSPDALNVARRNLADLTNCRFHCASVDAMPFADASMDFGYSLGVLHHVPDTAAAIRACVLKLKPGAPFLIYLYYALDNRPRWFREVWRVSNAVRLVLSRLPRGPRYAFSQVLAATVYWPLARLSLALERAGLDPALVPLSLYRAHSFYVMRTDALDRFGTRLEKRFTRAAILELLTAAGLQDIAFSDRPPFWCAIGWRTPAATAGTGPEG